MKPDDVTQDAWDKACDVLTTVTNNNHCWGIFDGAPEGYTNELHEAVAREIGQARSQAYEEMVIVGWYDPSNKDPGQSVTFDRSEHEMWPHIYRVPLFADPSQAIRQHSQKGEDK